MLGVSVPSDVDVDEESKALRIPRLSPSDGSPDYLVSGEDIVDIKPKLWTLGAQSFPWKIDAGSEILIDPACLSGCGATKLPIKLAGDREVLSPPGEQIIYSAYAPYSSYVAQITGDSTNAAVAFSLPGGNPKIPQLLLYKGLGIRVRASFKHASGATAPYLRIYLGNSNSLSSQLLVDGWTSAAAEEMGFDVTVRITTLGVSNAGAYTVTEGHMFDSKGVSKALNNAYLDRAISTNVDLYVLLACFPNNQTIKIQRLQISLVP